MGDGPHPPAPSPTFGEGVEGLDCGLRRNDGGRGRVWIAAYAAMTMDWVR